MVRKYQAFVIYLLILAILGGFTRYFISTQSEKKVSDYVFQKNGTPENLSIFLAEEEIDNVESLKKAQIFSPLAVISPTFFTAPSTGIRTHGTMLRNHLEKKFLLQLQLRI